MTTYTDYGYGISKMLEQLAASVRWPTASHRDAARLGAEAVRVLAARCSELEARHNDADGMAKRIAALQQELVHEAHRTAEALLKVRQMADQHRMQCNIRADLEAEIYKMKKG